MIAIIDYDAGNLRSVEKALEAIGQEAVVTRDRNEILSSDKVILPGVGSFGDAMGRLNEYGLVNTIHEVVDSGKPFLGICLGLQLLFRRSDESDGVEGLSILPGEILRIPDAPGIKIPHIGWNSRKVSEGARLFEGLGENPYVYLVAATTEYGGTIIHASVQRDNVYACQFHPEKSGSVGMQILKNFAAL